MFNSRMVSMLVVIGMIACPVIANTLPAGWTPSNANCGYFETGGNPGGYVNITGYQSEKYTWISAMVAVTGNTLYNVALDYKTGANGTFAQFEYFTSANGWINKFEFYDHIADGWLPSLTSASTWTHKAASLTTPANAAFIRVTLINWCGWGNVSSFDNVSIKTATGSNLVYNPGFAVPEPMTLAILGIGSLCFARKR